MINERIYIAGKITGDADYKAKFRNAETVLLAMDWNYWFIVNPVKECKEHWSWLRCMIKCLFLLKDCKYVAMLPDWRESRGARIEHSVAKRLNKTIIYIEGV